MSQATISVDVPRRSLSVSQREIGGGSRAPLHRRRERKLNPFPATVRRKKVPRTRGFRFRPPQPNYLFAIPLFVVMAIVVLLLSPLALLCLLALVVLLFATLTVVVGQHRLCGQYERHNG
jgi:Flp pilus assembly protein TadB